MIDASTELLSHLPLFKDLPNEILHKIALSIETLDCQAGETLALQGEHGNFVWIIASGRVQMLVTTHHTEQLIECLTENMLVGESMLLLGGAHTATFRTESDCSLLRLDVRVFSACVRHNPVVWKQFAVAHMLETALASIASVVFGGSAADVMALAKNEEHWHFLAKGEVLARQNEPAENWFLVISGELSAWKGKAGQLHHVGMLRRGDIAGELALITDKPHNAHLVAHRDTWLVRFAAAQFRPLFSDSPQAQNGLLRSLEKLLSPPLPSSLKQTGMRIAVFPVSDNVDIAQHVKQLAQEMSRLTPVRVLDAQECERLNIVHETMALEPGNVQWLRLSMWLEQQALQGTRVILVGDDPASAWSHHIYRECDLALYVCDGSQAPKPYLSLPFAAHSPQQHLAAPWLSPHWLCLVHPVSTLRPSGTAAWLDHLKVSSHYHVQIGRAADFGRLARHLAGHAVGLALSGGGARGTAHAGVYRAIVEAGIPVDFLAGTSAGALMACLLADGKGSAFAAQRAHEGLNSQKYLFGDYTLPIIALLKSKRLQRAVVSTFDDQTLEDSWIPCTVITTNLSKARREIFTRGAIQKIALASISPPAITKPVLIGDDLHCDGGLIDNLPIDALKAHGCRYTVASFAGSQLQLSLPDGEFPSTWLMLRDRLFNGGKRTTEVPRLLELLVAATTLASDAALPIIQESVDLFLAPNLNSFSVLDFSQTARIVESAYSQSCSALDRHRLIHENGDRRNLWELVEKLAAPSSIRTALAAAQ
jgi:predicted acylesterase/phospholipase RssA/CRP-like cAMP-binding protein